MSLRVRILLIFLITGVAGAGALVRWMSAELEPRYLEAQEDLMVDMSQVLATAIESDALIDKGGQFTPDALQLNRRFGGFPQRYVSAQIHALHKQKVDLRVYVTNANGTVVFDSDDRDVGADYSDWRDVEMTLVGEYGARTSANDPLFANGSVMYVAAPLYHRGKIVGTVSVGKPTRNAERFLTAAIHRFIIASVLALLSAFLIAAVIYRWVSLPLQRLYDYARDLQAGRRVAQPALGRNEIGRIGQAMSELRNALDGKAYVEQYVQSLTHELKSPTAAICGAAELLAEDLPPADRRRFIANIRDESGRLQQLIDRMLELASIENRNALDDPQFVLIEKIIDDAVEGMGALIRHKRLRVDRMLPPDQTVFGDAFLLRLAIDNLLKNAIEFSPDAGTITIESRVEQRRLYIIISDQGPGIPVYARDRVLERFYSLPRPDGRKGTGLGLNYVREVAALHGGTLRLDATDNGTRATLCLPATAANESKTSSDKKTAGLNPGDAIL